jgi:hypothetical protein
MMTLSSGTSDGFGLSSIRWCRLWGKCQPLFYCLALLVRCLLCFKSNAPAFYPTVSPEQRRHFFTCISLIVSIPSFELLANQMVLPRSDDQSHLNANATAQPATSQTILCLGCALPIWPMSFWDSAACYRTRSDMEERWTAGFDKLVMHLASSPSPYLHHDAGDGFAHNPCDGRITILFLPGLSKRLMPDI